MSCDPQRVRLEDRQLFTAVEPFANHGQIEQSSMLTIGHSDSKVAHLSPFRYPGGKSWLVPQVARWIMSFDEAWRSQAHLFEPFAGGANVGLHAAHEHLVSHVTLVELDAAVAAVWETILSGDAKWLTRRIKRFEFSATSVEEELETRRRGTKQRAFQTILRNRVTRGGILADGAGLLRRGENNKGLASRWYPEVLVSRITRIALMHDRITFVHGDGLRVIEAHEHDEGALFFIDPPYTAGGDRAGARLYTHSDLDHERLFAAAEALGARCLMTYDNSQQVRDLAAAHHLQVRELTMMTAHHKKKVELLISANFGWFDQPQQLEMDMSNE